VTVKSLATGVAAVAAIGAAAAGVTCIAFVTAASPPVQPVVFGLPSPASGRYPQPLDPVVPGADVPTPDQLITVLNSLQDPSLPFASKSNLVEGGVDGIEGHYADKKLQQAAARGSLPLSFNIANIQPAGPGAASANVTAAGPHLAPTTENITFVDQGGWKLSRTSAMTLIQSVQSAGG
jgi:hypothetical protein